MHHLLSARTRPNPWIAMRAIACLAISWCWSGHLLNGQDLFSGFADQINPTDAAASKVEPAPPDAQIIELNQLAARGGNFLGDAISAFARIKRWTDADRWLQQGVGAINDPNQLSEIAERIGADNLLRLSTSDELSENAKAMLSKLGEARRRVSQSTERLAEAIDHLDAPSVDLRLESARHLLAGGTASIAALVEAAVSENPSAPREAILKALLRFGDNGPTALEQFAIYGEATARANATESLTRIDAKKALPNLLTAYFGTDSTDAEQSFAKANLPPVTQTLPTFNEGKGYLFSELKRLRRRALEIENNFDTVTLWSISDDRTSVNHRSTREIIATYRDAVDMAMRLRRLGDLSDGMFDTVLAADISYRVMIDPDWGTPEQIDAIQQSYGDSISAQGLSHAIELADKNSDSPAAIGLLRMIGQISSSFDSRTLLVGNHSQMTPLVKATLHGEPRVRFEAAAAIVRLDPPASFTGSSHFLRCLAEMRDLQNLPRALLVETRSEVALQQELILAKMGFETEIVGSVLDLERCVALGGDLRLILSKTQLWDIPPVEMIDRVRRIPRGKSVPIAFYGEPAAGIESDRWTGLSRLIDRPGTPAAFTDLLMDLDLINRLPDMTAIDRQQFRKIATDHLETLR